MARDHACVPWEYLEEMDALEDVEFGRLMRALLKYSMTGETAALTGNERFYWKRVMLRENRYQESYKTQSAANARNGAFGGRKPAGKSQSEVNRNKPNESEINRNKPNESEIKQNKADESEIKRNKADESERKRKEAKKSEKTQTKTEAKTEAKTETKTKAETETEREYGDQTADAVCAEPPAASAPPPVPETPPVFRIPLVDGTFFPVTADMLSHWRELYPAVDVDQQVRSMIGWCEANPRKRKTKRGIQGFVTRWLDKEQDRGGGFRADRQPPRNSGPGGGYAYNPGDLTDSF